VIAPALLQGRDRYERAMDGWVDNTHPDAFTHTVVLRDDDQTVELSVVAEPSPSYLIQEARCRRVAGALDPALAASIEKLAGTQMIGGLSRRVAELTGSGPGAGFVLGAVVEVARLARQVARLPAERAARAARGNAWECWQLDMTAGSTCRTRASRTPMRDGASSRRARSRRRCNPISTAHDWGSGASSSARRWRGSRAGTAASRFFHSMHDNVHGFEITLRDRSGDRDDRAGRARHAAAAVHGHLLGASTEDRGAPGRDRRRWAPPTNPGHLGGETGCAQLYDLTADLLKLLA